MRKKTRLKSQGLREAGDSADIARAKSIVDAIQILHKGFTSKLNIAEASIKMLDKQVGSTNSPSYEKDAKKRLAMLAAGFKQFDKFLEMTGKMEIAAQEVVKYFSGEYGTEEQDEGVDDMTPEEGDEMLKEKISEIMHGDDDEATKLEAIREAIGDEAPAEDDEMDSGTEPDDEDEMSAMEDDDEKTEEEDEDDDAVKEAEDDGAETAEDDEEDEDKLSEAEGDEDDEDDEEEDTPEGYRRMRRKLKKMKESLRTFQKDSHARKALESVGLKPTARLIEDLRGMAPAAIIRHAKRLAISERATKPRSSGYTGNTNSKPGFDINSILN